MDLFHFDPTVFLGFLLTLIRISLVVFLLPFFGASSLPTSIKAALCLVLSLALWPKLSFPASMFPANVWSLGLMLAGEILMGLMLDILVRFLFAPPKAPARSWAFPWAFPS